MTAILEDLIYFILALLLLKSGVVRNKWMKSEWKWKNKWLFFKCPPSSSPDPTQFTPKTI